MWGPDVTYFSVNLIPKTSPTEHSYHLWQRALKTEHVFSAGSAVKVNAMMYYDSYVDGSTQWMDLKVLYEF